jgi:hypothetical protein
VSLYPCCGYLVFDEPPGSYLICAVCGWEDDISQLRFPTMGGAQSPLLDCQAAVAQRGVDTATRAQFQRDPSWRPIDLSREEVEVPEPGVDYGMSYPDDPTDLYYWRR